jgi:hypothetical protein
VNFDFELNQAAQPNLTTEGDKTLVRTPGDLLITYEFQGGAQKPTLNKSLWQQNGGWGPFTAISDAASEGQVNSAPVVTPSARPSPGQRLSSSTTADTTLRPRSPGWSSLSSSATRYRLDE